MSEGWGAWIVHDGAAPACLPDGYVFELEYAGAGRGVRDWSVVDLSRWPGMFWRWRRVRVGWFRSELRRVCDDPAYAPIGRYRLRRQRGMVVLERLLAEVRERVE